MQCKSGQANVRHKFFKWIFQTEKYFFLKNRLLNKMISKHQVNRRSIFTGKMHFFLKVLATFYKEISETIRTLELSELENTAYLLKKLKSFNGTWLIMNCSFSYQRKFLLLFYSEWEENSLPTHWQKYFSHTTHFSYIVIITEKFNIHFSRITWLEATGSFLLDCAPNFINAPLL